VIRLSLLVSLLEHRRQTTIGGDNPVLEVPAAGVLDELIVLAALLEDLR
jgi:hypothetical protein